MDDLTRLEEKIDKISSAVSELCAMWPHLCRRVDRLETEVFGNGSRPGLISRVQLLYLVGSACLWLSGTLIGALAMWLTSSR